MLPYRWMRAVALSLIAVSLLAGALHADVLSPPAKRQWDYAVHLFQEGMHAEAKEEFERFVERYGAQAPGEAAEARFWTAVSLSHLGSEGEAAEAFAAYLRLHPDGPRAAEARWERAMSLYRAGDFVAAEAIFLEVLDADTGVRRCEAEYQLGRAYAVTGRPKEAAPYLESAMATCPGETWIPDALYALAYAYDRAGREGEAIEIAGRIRGANPRTAAAASAEALVGEIYTRRGDFAAARRHYAAAYEAARTSKVGGLADYLHWRAWAAIRDGDGAAGRTDLRAIVDSFPESPRRVEALISLGGLAIESGETGTARACFLRLAEEYAGTDVEARARYDLARIALAAGEAGRALDEADAAVALGRILVVEARLVRGRALLSLGRLDEAVAAFQAVLSDSPAGPLAAAARLGAAEGFYALRNYEEAAEMLGDDRTWEGRFRYAQNLYQLGRVDEAIAVWQEIVESAPAEDRGTADEAAYWIGAGHYTAGRFADAAAALEAFAVDHPSSPLRPEALYWLGWARLKSGDVDGAVDAFRRCAALPGPRAAGAALRVAQAYADAARWVEAAAAFSAAADSFPAVADEARISAAEVEHRAGRTAAALDILDRMERGEGGATVEASWRRAAILDEVDTSGAAAGEAFSSFAERHPADPRRGEALYRAGRAFARAGGARTAEAERLFEEAAGESVVAPKALMALASLLEIRGETREASARYGRLAESWPENPLAGEARVRRASLRGDTTALLDYARGASAVACLARLELGRLNLAAGLADSSVGDLREALECLPEGDDLAAEALLLLGTAEESRGKPAAAITEYRKLTMLYPNSPYTAAAREALDRLERGRRGGRRR